MEYEFFCQKCKEIEEGNQAAEGWLYNAATSKFDKALKFSSTKNIVSLFYGDNNKLGRALYQKRKRIICILYDWLYEQGAIEENIAKWVHEVQYSDIISEREIMRFYFANLDEALGYITTVGKSVGMGDETDLLNVKTIVILAWHGFDVDEMLNLKKSDLLVDDGIIKLNGREISVCPRHMKILSLFAKTDRHCGFPTQRQQNYKDSIYLMRSAYQDHMTPNNIWCTLRRFNVVGVNYDMELSVLCLRRCGLFRRIYDEKSEKSINTLIQREIQCDTAFAVGYKELYEKWKAIKVQPHTDGENKVCIAFSERR